MEAARFLKRSGLSDVVLSRIWDLSDPGGRGSLDKAGFFVALKLVALAQAGRDINVSNLNMELPPPKMVHIRIFNIHYSHYYSKLSSNRLLHKYFNTHYISCDLCCVVMFLWSLHYHLILYKYCYTFCCFSVCVKQLIDRDNYIFLINLFRITSVWSAWKDGTLFNFFLHFVHHF